MPNLAPHDDPTLKQHLSEGQYEYVDVTFAAAATDTIIPYSTLTPEDPDEVRFIDITPNVVYSGGIDTVAHVYRSGAPSALAWAEGYLVLRSTVAGYTTRLRLFLERS